LIIDSIVDLQSAIVLHIYIYIEGGGLDPLQLISRANSADLANKSHKKLGTLTDSARVWTVRAISADCPDHGPSGLEVGPSARPFWCPTYAPAF
jgi:hypothetical protein